jgi:hypothetical protein
VFHSTGKQPQKLWEFVFDIKNTVKFSSTWNLKGFTIFLKKPTRCTNFSILFLEWDSNYFGTVSLSITKCFLLVHNIGNEKNLAMNTESVRIM